MRRSFVLVIVIIVAIVAFLFSGYFRLPVSPWSWSLFRKHTLTGSWCGIVTSENNVRRAMFLSLHVPTRLQATRNVEGSAQLFPVDGQTVAYQAFGRFDGSRLSLKLFAGDPQQPSSGGTMEGTWAADQLDVTRMLLFFRSSSSAEREAPDYTGTLKKGGEAEYRALCRQVPPAQGGIHP
jgi:hypothetical protein